MSTTVTYKGNTLATVENATKTLKTAGKYMEGDVTLTDVSSAAPTLQAKGNIAPSTSSQTITPDAGYDGLSSVQINAMPNGSATTPATTITAPPTLSVANSTGIVTASISKTQSVTPSVSAGYVSSGTAGNITVSGSNTLQLNTQAATTITPSTQVQTAVPSGRFTTGAVTVAAIPTGSAGTPTATKSAVTNHSVSVTPSVTNTTGYITGGTKTGTAVTVSASELVSGTLSITENGTANVTNYASVSVNVSGGGSATIEPLSATANGTYTAPSGVDGYNPVTVYVTDGATPYTLIDSREITLTNYTTTSAATQYTITDTRLTSGKIVCVFARDKAGRRNGYFFGTDTILPTNGYGSNNQNGGRRTYKIDDSGNLVAFASNTGASPSYAYGIFAQRITPSGAITIQSRYNATNTGIIDGTYKVEIYVLDYPDGTTP